jgi:acetaldehyde dehydrogenase/alcohol dehydrogenase
MSEKNTPSPQTTSEINKLVANALTALEEYMSYSQEKVDNIVMHMALAGLSAQARLAKMAVEETGRGVYEDKIIKNIFATEYIYHSIKYEKTVGIVNEDQEEGYFEIAEPVGVIAGVTPVTNPTSTTLFKSIISQKTRNPIVFAFHPSAHKCSAEAARIVKDAAVSAGAPEHCIQWVETPSIEATNFLMNHPNISLVLATGGSGMVRAAYSTGKPALGVGPGNVPCFIEKSANIKRAVTDLILSRSFDNGMICASEQGAIIEEAVYKETTDFMKFNKCYFASKNEIEKLTPFVILPDTGSVNPKIVGMPPYKIAELAGLTIPKDTKIICCEIDGVGPQYPLSKEKLSPLLIVLKAKDAEH